MKCFYNIKISQIYLSSIYAMFTFLTNFSRMQSGPTALVMNLILILLKNIMSSSFTFHNPIFGTLFLCLLLISRIQIVKNISVKSLKNCNLQFLKNIEREIFNRKKHWWTHLLNSFFWRKQHMLKISLLVKVGDWSLI